MASDPLLVLRGISKAFPGVQALSAVDLEVGPGEIHGLVGENGAGKSTLVAIAAGVLQPDSGSVEVAGHLMTNAAPQVARQLGVAIVHQEPALLPDLTVGENLYMGVSGDRRPRPGRVAAWASPQLDRWGAGRIDPTLRTGSLAPSSRFVVEITKALAQDPRVLILDEPTEHLDPDDVDFLFESVRRGARAGWGVVYISHRIREIKQIAHRITVLRDGTSRGTFDADDLSEREVINLIVGRPFETAFPSKAEPRPASGPALESVDLEGPAFSDLTLEVRPGEVLGFAGIDGHGQREALRALAGMGQATGIVKVDGTALKRRPEFARDAGIVYIPRDRHVESIFPGLVVRENLLLGDLRSVARFGFVRRILERRRVSELMAKFGVRATGPEAAIETLSGGNQQKVVLARTIGGHARVLLADGPTQGVDVGARMEIYKHIRDFAAGGGAVVVVSSDGIELAGLCDRVLVFSRGRVAGSLIGNELNEHAITSLALTATTGRRFERPSRRLSGLRFSGGDLGPSIGLAGATALLGLAAAAANDSYLSVLNFRGFLAFLATLVFVAFGQQIVMMAGGIDLSVGPLMGFLVVVSSFFLTSEEPVGPKAVGWLLIVGVALLVGLINWALIEITALHPVVATLVTFMALRGLSLTLRPVPGGLIEEGITDGITVTLGFVPVSILAGIAAAVILEYSLRRSWWGVATRGTGSDPLVARDLGVPVKWVRLAAYLACALLTSVSAILLMAQVGSGNPTAGITYTLTSIAAVVLGGTSIFGGRGSFIGTLMGALLLQQIIIATTFLGLGEEWRSYLLGGLTILAVAGYSRVRSQAQRI